MIITELDFHVDQGKIQSSGKRGIITGASRGLGRGMAEGLAEMGAGLVLVARDGDRLQAVAEEFRTFEGTILPVVTDVSDDGDLERLVETACSELGGIDFLFCNAGIVRRGISHEHSPDDFDDVFRVNVRSVFMLCKMAARVMIEQGTGGSIVITDSVVSFHGSRNVPGYTSSKGAIHSLIRAFANDWGAYGIRVNGIGPASAKRT